MLIISTKLQRVPTTKWIGWPRLSGRLLIFTRLWSDGGENGTKSALRLTLQTAVPMTRYQPKPCLGTATTIQTHLTTLLTRSQRPGWLHSEGDLPGICLPRNQDEYMISAKIIVMITASPTGVHRRFTGTSVGKLNLNRQYTCEFVGCVPRLTKDHAARRSIASTKYWMGREVNHNVGKEP